MKTTKAQLLQLIKEETEGEMQFAPLETARQAYLQDPNDETKHQLGLMVEKLVEPIMAKLVIDPRGSRGGYDLKVSPLPGAEDDFEVIEDTFGSMKGVTQFIYDLENPLDDGMVGEPEGQMELPLENRVRITKSQLQKIIKEELLQEARRTVAEEKTYSDADARLKELDNLIQDLIFLNKTKELKAVLKNYSGQIGGF
jgi:hypothetical protein